MEDGNNKCSILLFSGDMDKVMAAFLVATSAAAMGMETSMFFSFWGLKAIQKGTPTGEGLFGKMLSVMNRGGLDRLGPSRLNMGGMGRWMFKKMMKQKNVATLAELRQTAIDLGVKFLACQMSMQVMEVTCDDLIPEVQDIVGAATYVAEAKQAHLTLFV